MLLTAPEEWRGHCRPSEGGCPAELIRVQSQPCFATWLGLPLEFKIMM